MSASCCGKEMNIKRDFLYDGYDLGCHKCHGTGRQYLSDGVYWECDCLHGWGVKVLWAECGECFNKTRDFTRKLTSRRIRAHLRCRLIKKEAALIEHLSSMFLDGMSWDNRSEWHIDHIKPIKAFLDDEITDLSIINALSNLQPLWAKDNLSKGAKYNEKG